MNVKVVDAFPFFNELDMLRARTNELRYHVSHYVLAECFQTFRGDPKPLYFAENKAGFKDIPITHVAATMPDTEDDWVRERFSRTPIEWVLSTLGLKDEDVVMVSDADEIIRADAVQRIVNATASGPVALVMPLYCYTLNWKVTENDDQPTTRARAFRWADRPHNLSRFRALDNLPRVEDAGWHFSWFGGPESRVHKVKSFAHSECDRDDYYDHLRAGPPTSPVFGMEWVDDPFPQTITQVLGGEYERIR